ncbi:MAG: hypothetical protein NTU43_12115 [Bacteroidetes bacterium]|nr:hypothetical protein [Bacteroidota bacterium]
MNKQYANNRLMLCIFFPILFSFFLSSCNTLTLQTSYIGDWQSSKNSITVSNLGTAIFVNGKIKNNYGSDVAYIVECGTIGKIYTKDPLEKKEVELWLLTMNDNDSLKAELRFTGNLSAFPMADIFFTRVIK